MTMTIALETQAHAIIDKITSSFRLLNGLYEARRYSSVDKIIEALRKDILLLTKIDGNLITALIEGLNDMKDENLRGMDSNPDNFHLYFQLINEDIAKLKDFVEREYRPEQDNVALPPLVIGNVEKVYGRIMSSREYDELKKTKTLWARSRPYTVIPVFEAPPKIVDFFMNTITRDKVHNLVQALGGGGNVQVVVIFKTKYKPVVENLPCRHLPLLREAKLATGTKIEILRTRNV